MPMRAVAVALFLLLCACLAGTAIAQTTVSDIDALRKELSERTEAMGVMDAELSALKGDVESGYAAAVKRFHQSQVEFYDYQNDLREQAQSVLFWQLVSAYVLLALVVLVTGLGIILSFVEVKEAMSLPGKVLVAGAQGAAAAGGAAPAPGAPPPAMPPTTLEISAQRLQVTSAVTGIVVLVISLAFLYLFVDRVLSLQPTDITTMHEPPKVDDAGGDPAPEGGSKADK